MVDPRLDAGVERVLVVAPRPTVDDEDRRVRRLRNGLGDESVHAVDVEITEGDSGRRRFAGSAQDHTAGERMRRRRGSGVGQLVPDVPVGKDPSAGDGPGLCAQPLQRSRREVVAMELRAAAVLVCDEERFRVGIPVGGGLSREIEHDVLDL